MKAQVGQNITLYLFQPAKKIFQYLLRTGKKPYRIWNNFYFNKESKAQIL